MDTSGTNLGNVAKPRTDQYSKEELSSILKFGAANIFKTDADQSKLEEMDLDDVINKAEAYDTETVPTGTSLGGEAFLNQFAVQDVKADMTSWDDIIPAADREAAEVDRKANAVASGSGSRSNQMDVDDDDEGSVQGGNSSKVKEEKKEVVKRKTDAQRTVELSDKDVRGLVRGIQRFGDIRHRYALIVADAKLESKSRSTVLTTVDELIEVCRKGVKDKSESLESRKAAGNEISQAERTKAPMVSYKGSHSINAETVVQRADELKSVHTCAYFSYFFRITFFY